MPGKITLTIEGKPYKVDWNGSAAPTDAEVYDIERAIRKNEGLRLNGPNLGGSKPMLGPAYNGDPLGDPADDPRQSKPAPIPYNDPRRRGGFSYLDKGVAGTVPAKPNRAVPSARTSTENPVDIAKRRNTAPQAEGPNGRYSDAQLQAAARRKYEKARVPVASAALDILNAMNPFGVGNAGPDDARARVNAGTEVLARIAKDYGFVPPLARGLGLEDTVAHLLGSVPALPFNNASDAYTVVGPGQDLNHRAGAAFNLASQVVLPGVAHELGGSVLGTVGRATRGRFGRGLDFGGRVPEIPPVQVSPKATVIEPVEPKSAIPENAPARIEDASPAPQKPLAAETSQRPAQAQEIAIPEPQGPVTATPEPPPSPLPRRVEIEAEAPGRRRGQARPQEGVEPTATNNASMGRVRENADLDKLPATERESVGDWAQAAVSEGKVARASKIARDILDKPRPMTKVEESAMRQRSVEIQNRLKEIERKATQTDDDVNEHVDLLGDLDAISDATKRAGSEWGRAGVARQVELANSYDRFSLRQRARGAAKRKLTQAEEDYFIGVEARETGFAKREAELVRQQQEFAAAQVKAATQRRTAQEMAGVRSGRRGLTRERIQAGRTAAIDRLRELTKVGETQSLNSGVSTEYLLNTAKVAREYANVVSSHVQELALTAADKADVTLAKAIDAAHDTLTKAGIKVTKEELMQAFAGRYERVAQTPSEARQMIGRLRREARELTAPPKPVKPPKEPVGPRQGPPRPTRRAGGALDTDPLGPAKPRKGEPGFDDLQRNRRAEAIQGQIDELNRQLRENDFPAKPQTSKQIDEAIEKLRDERDVARRRVNAKIEELRPKSVIEQVVNGANATRSILASGDMSAVFRQAAVLSLNPLRARATAKSFVSALRAMMTEEGAARVARAIQGDPQFAAAQKAGLEFGSLEGTLSKAEEAFAYQHFTNAGGKSLPVIGQLKSIVRGSDRHMATYLDSVRFEAFKSYSRWVKDPAEVARYADWLNVITGRPRLKTGRALSTALFSPKLAASRFIYTPAHIARAAATPWKPASAAVLTDFGAFVGSAYGIAKVMEARGYSVSFDPKSPDFLKAKKGNERVDILGGYAQAARYWGQLALMGKDRVTGVPAGKEDAFDLTKRQLRNKLAPIPGLAFNIVNGKDAVGKEFGVKEAAQTFLPLGPKEAVETYNERGLSAAVEVFARGFFGFGSQYYKSKEPKS